MSSRRRSSSPLPPPGLPKKCKYLAADDSTRVAFQRCGKLLEKLLNHEDGWVFAKPVDARDLGILDYYSTISNPMDLGTVGRRLERRRYASPHAFAEDIRLVFSNAMIYNNMDDDVYKSAIELSRIFELGWASIFAKIRPVPSVEEHVKSLNDVFPQLSVDVRGEVAAILKDKGRCDGEVSQSAQLDLDLVNEASLGDLECPVSEHDLSCLTGITTMKKQKCKEGEPDEINYLKECHNSSKKGFIEPVKEAIAHMVASEDQVPIENRADPETSTPIVPEILSQSSAKCLKVQQLQNALAAEQERSIGFIQEVGALNKHVRESEDKLLKYQQEIEAVRKKQEDSDAILAEVLKQVKVNIP